MAHSSDDLEASAATRQSRLISRLRQARQKTDAFFELLTPQALYSRAIPERHRLVFYVGHLEAFDWNLICNRVCAESPLHRRFEDLFAFGIDPVDGNLPCDTATEWPDLDALLAYRAQAREAIDCSLEKTPCAGPLQMAVEHRLMHLETLAYMLPQLPLTSFVAERIAVENTQPGPIAADYARTGSPHAARIIRIPAGRATLGKPRDGSFGWDNEYDEHTIDVPAFAVAARKVTNGELLRFVLDGGYADRALWSEEDWQWQQSLRLAHPLLWSKNSSTAPDGFLLRTAFAEVPLPLDWPAQVSLAEARAYLRYVARSDGNRGARLLSEAEFHRAAFGTDASAQDAGRERELPWGDALPVPLFHGNFGCARYDYSPVGAFPAGDSAFGVADLIGNGWEWTHTPFAPFAGFAIDPHYPGYSQPFFDGKHFVMKGASARTDTIFLRRSFRNWFQPHYPYVFATFRCAYDAGAL